MWRQVNICCVLLTASEDEALPADITSDVDEDNGKFQKELEEWDEEMQSKLHKSDDRRIEEEPIGREVKRRKYPLHVTNFLHEWFY